MKMLTERGAGETLQACRCGVARCRQFHFAKERCESFVKRVQLLNIYDGGNKNDESVCRQVMWAPWVST
jgi:hypothetical protein